MTFEATNIGELTDFVGSSTVGFYNTDAESASITTFVLCFMAVFFGFLAVLGGSSYARGREKICGKRFASLCKADSGHAWMMMSRGGAISASLLYFALLHYLNNFPNMPTWKLGELFYTFVLDVSSFTHGKRFLRYKLLARVFWGCNGNGCVWHCTLAKTKSESKLQDEVPPEVEFCVPFAICFGLSSTIAIISSHQ